MAGDRVASGLSPEDQQSSSSVEDVVLDSSRTLMGAHPDEFDTKLSWTLGSVGEALGADRCGTYQADPESDGSTLTLTHEWTADGVDDHAEARRVISADAFPWLFERLQGFQPAEARPASSLPDEASALGDLLAEAGVDSAVFVPLVSNWSLLGAVSFEALEGSHLDVDRVDLAKTFGDMVAHAVAQTRRERELRRKNERLEQFASVVSHDLRNPLNVAKASIDLARGDGAADHLDRAADATDRMERIVEQVLTLARLGQDIGETEPSIPSVVAEAAWESIQAVDASLTVTEVEAVEADRDRLREAFENLFRNAIEHGGPDVAVRVGPLREEPGFYVADDGSGIPEEEREAVFEQGYSTADDGTGLGLSIVSRIVRSHGWEIDACESESGGARFEIRTGSSGFDR